MGLKRALPRQPGQILLEFTNLSILFSTSWLLCHLSEGPVGANPASFKKTKLTL